MRQDREVRPAGRAKGVSGVSLIDVLVAMAVVALGVLAFLLLQGNMARAGLDAELRTVASGIAEETLESQRRFTRLDTDPDGAWFAYEDIADVQSTRTVGGIDFTVRQTVVDYYWDKSEQAFTTTAPSESAHSDFKRVTVAVEWENPLEYVIDEFLATDGHLASGGVELTTIFSSAVSATSRLALLDELNAESFQPPLIGPILDDPALPLPLPLPLPGL